MLALCLNQISAESAAKTTSRAALASRRHGDRRGDRRRKRRRRRVTRERRDREPDDGEDDRRRPSEADQRAEIGRDALAAAELEPDRIHVAEDRARSRRERRRRPKQPPRQHDRQRRLQRVERERRRRQPLAAGAQDIGGADVARADRAQVPCPGSLVSTRPKGIDPSR